MISTWVEYVGLAIVLVLILLLVQRELLQAYGSLRTKAWIRILDIAIIPLLIAFGVVAVTRLMSQ
jgi:hypothetical protein